jgi:hypothetical protein
MRLVYRVSVALAALALLSLGCSGKKAANYDQGENHIKKLAILYGRYQGKNHRSPANEKEFKEFIRKFDPTELGEGFDLSDVEKMFVSPRDGQSYGVAYGVAPSMPGPGQPLAVVWEKKGSLGKRYVALASTEVKEVDDVEFKKYVPSGGGI